MEVAGPLALAKQEGFLAAADEAIGPEWPPGIAAAYYYSRAVSIVGGSNEVQRNIIAKRILGL